ncbi:MAG: HAD family phosphatase [Phycisphaerales bacterium]|nr:MAG: HAD family phosphatase [Phycisphaerales bacterium]
MYGLILDMDGVLIDSAAPHWESWKLLGDEIGVPVSEQQFRETFGRSNRDIVPLLFGRDDEASIRRLSDRKEELYRDLIRGHVPAVDGAADLVRGCHDAGFKLAIGSSGPRENVELVLAGMRIAPYFQTLVTAGQVTRGKPDPQVFELAAEGLGVSPGRCAVVEDAPAGIEAALAAGATAIALATTHPPERLHRAHHVVTTMRALSAGLIEQWIRQRPGG